MDVGMSCFEDLINWVNSPARFQFEAIGACDWCHMKLLLLYRFKHHLTSQLNRVQKAPQDASKWSSTPQPPSYHESPNPRRESKEDVSIFP